MAKEPSPSSSDRYTFGGSGTLSGPGFLACREVEALLVVVAVARSVRESVEEDSGGEGVLLSPPVAVESEPRERDGLETWVGVVSVKPAAPGSGDDELEVAEWIDRVLEWLTNPPVEPKPEDEYENEDLYEGRGESSSWSSSSSCWS